MEEIPGCPERGGKPNVCKNCKATRHCSDMARNQDVNYPTSHGHVYTSCTVCENARLLGLSDSKHAQEFWSLKNKYKGRTRKSFVALVGPMQYKQIMNKPQSWRYSYADTALCEIKDCANTGEYGDVFVFDHCHAHGWIRGLVCTSHNVRLGHIDSVRKIPGVQLSLAGTSYRTYLNNCPECATSTVVDISSAQEAA